MRGFSCGVVFDMYAVVRTGGKQYRVSAGEKLRIERLAAEVGQEIVLDQVLLVADGEALKWGAPLVSGASVKAKVLGHGRGDKIRVFKLNRRKHYRKSRGHRQNFTEIEILGIAG
jgi:large subunit ribosomal protein L21